MSFSNGQIGELMQKDNGITVEWIIKDFSQYTKEDECFQSPSFTVPGSRWQIRICPYGQTSNNSVGWISVYLVRDDDFAYPKKVYFAFSAKAESITFHSIIPHICVVKDQRGKVGCSRFLERTELKRKHSHFGILEDELIVVCIIKVEDAMECTSRLMQLSEDFTELFYSEKDCDTTMRVQREEFSAHRLVLSARSPVFEAMFSADMREKETGTVDIPDCHPKAFKDFLTYLYSGVYQNHSGEVSEVYRIADKYDVEDLQSACVQHMSDCLSVDNVLEVSIFAHQFDELALTAECQEFFNENFLEIIASPKWESFLKEYFIIGNELLKSFGTTKKK